MVKKFLKGDYNNRIINFLRDPLKKSEGLEIF